MKKQNKNKYPLLPQNLNSTSIYQTWLTVAKNAANVILVNNKSGRSTECWEVRGKKIYVTSYCPLNHPSFSQHTMTRANALRQYALMTSETEGWKVEKADDFWYKFIDAKFIKIRNIPV